MTETPYTVRLGTPKLKKSHTGLHHKRAEVPLLDNLYQPLGMTLSAVRYADGSFHRFVLSFDRPPGRVPPPSLPQNRLFRDGHAVVRGPQWEWAATQVGQGTLPVERPGHPEDTLMDLMAQSFHQFVGDLEKDSLTTPSTESWIIPFAAQRLLRAGWPLSDTARATFQQAIAQFDSLPSRLHAPPVSIREADPPNRALRLATLAAGQEVRCQNYFRQDPYWLRLVTDGQAIPDELRQRLSPSSRPRPSP